MKNSPLITFTVIFLISCHTKMDYVLKEKDVIPEGTAFNAKRETLYISSIYQQKIIGIDKHREEYDAIDRVNFGDLSPIGIAFDPRTETLWTCAALAPIVNRGGGDQWRSTILSFKMDERKGRLIKKYAELDFEIPTFLNDITVTPDGTVYATESVNNQIYTIDPEVDSLEMFIELEGYTFPNGIVYDQHSKDVFIAVDQGILRLNPVEKKFYLLEASEGVDASVIDGLSIDGDYFIGHQSSKVTRFYFNESKTRLMRAEILDSGDEFDSSTTGKVGGGYYYFIVNSQIRSGINQTEKTIKPMDSLEQVIIRRIKL